MKPGDFLLQEWVSKKLKRPNYTLTRKKNKLECNRQQWFYKFNDGAFLTTDLISTILIFSSNPWEANGE